nr:30S ribosomal protein S21 [Planktothrix sp. FACHB-1355]
MPGQNKTIESYIGQLKRKLSHLEIFLKMRNHLHFEKLIEKRKHKAIANHNLRRRRVHY